MVIFHLSPSFATTRASFAGASTTRREAEDILVVVGDVTFFFAVRKVTNSRYSLSHRRPTTTSTRKIVVVNGRASTTTTTTTTFCRRTRTDQAESHSERRLSLNSRAFSVSFVILGKRRERCDDDEPCAARHYGISESGDRGERLAR